MLTSMKPDKKLVTVIVPTYGRSNELSNAIQSVLKQTYRNIELIIVDDNSCIKNRNAVKSVVSSFANDRDIIYLGDGINRGGAGARNLGLDIAKGEYVTFLDDDDFFSENKIEKQVQHIEKNNLDVSVCDMNFSQNGKFLDVSNCYARVNSLKDFIINGNCYTPMILARKDVLKTVNGFTKTPRFQDHLLMLKILAKEYKVGHIKEKLFTHSNHNGMRITYSSGSAIGFKKKFDEESKYLKLLNSGELQQYQFSKNLVEMKILRSTRSFLDLAKLTSKSFCNIRSFNQFYAYVKCLIRNVFFPNRHF
ncbi:hypothetical protein THMIRHAS_06420 [Thiosulfatimonas sediminis]|uniref:Glycosyltransferase 2-like domain-containing protein n=1 Tax=Thiosulfatimonas sediminis TaxID=2675054 RepID=A0A6F8PT37_9GAMM|nr:glycosyltransferase family 2 protein [Thiosulfatimonas sediminis]BBP45269.1 hypothetical protein THMIRHAS_06420 [Thiosulfatimonas sediminis]